MKRMEDCTFGFVGLGLMGGALAMALRREGVVGERGKIYAYDVNPRVLESARETGVIDEGFTSPALMLGSCDVVFLCLYPASAIAFMEQWMGSFKSGALITDIAGVKKGIVEKMETGLRDDLDFVPGHPMAGSEKEGFSHAASCNFRGRNYIFVPLRRTKPEHLAFMKELALRVGFTRIVETTAEAHDRKIAFTSQLCHVIASALIDCESDTSITEFGGGSFEDLTRIAMINAPMWTELFLENKDALLEQIEKFENSLSRMSQLIREEKSGELESLLAAVRERRVSMSAKI